MFRNVEIETKCIPRILDHKDGVMNQDQEYQTESTSLKEQKQREDQVCRISATRINNIQQNSVKKAQARTKRD